MVEIGWEIKIKDSQMVRIYLQENRAAANGYQSKLSREWISVKKPQNDALDLKHHLFKF